ncbi:alpha/beta hydrolase, partial [Pseudonocardia sp. NPDC049154]|uniref:alpha/beta fold hydrolase n=1 Tax=Pseudonocardia sp. NPDC049154 TaxID=3155501 RepID=UPI0033CBC2DD
MTTVISPDDELAALSEFALLGEDARAVGLFDCLPPVRRLAVPTPDGEVSALRWGDAEPRMVLLHDAGQSAHSWNAAVLATGLPALAVDLPGHSHSAWRTDGAYAPAGLARTLAPVLGELAPEADLMVGIGLGARTVQAVAADTPWPVRALVLLDGTPGADPGVAARTSFPSFADLLTVARSSAPGCGCEELRRTLLAAVRRLPDGSWTWRHDPAVGRPAGFSAALAAPTHPAVEVYDEAAASDRAAPARGTVRVRTVSGA